MTERQDSGEPVTRRARRVARSQRRGVAGKRRAYTPHHTVAKVITATLLALAMATGVSVVLVYNHWNGNLLVDDVADQLGNDRPKKKKVEGPQEPMNILVMGSDTREGEGNNIDGMNLSGERSDTTILIHLSASREFAYGISIPRDTMVDRPTCFAEDGSEIPGEQDAIWNDAFSIGGPACTIRQFEQLSGVRIDNYVVVDFGGFKDMVDALDGVEVCIPEEIVDTEHNITLEPGTREIRGDEALSYVRVRSNISDGSDPQRIRRQQAFMASMLNKAVDLGMLARPDRIVGFMNALTGSLQTDFENVSQIADIGSTFRGVGLGEVKFVTTPWQAWPPDPNRIEWTPEVDRLWELVVNDEPLTAEFAEESISAADDPEGTDATDSTEGTEGTDAPTDEGAQGGKKGGDEGLSDDAREYAGLCT
ncbi:LCP family protein required for cell wall assembly [Nocardioides thalensis]|uniref:LCP family protein required for cell wall assembly n=1 Tax=Nocardioides thalensis TaxID=1914755 RepID=A0A853BY55_9ACTN|nr:LCP family protein [Nocardioides thalensis]NYI99776.1 LCP family protein required for cell wall assembly [Nocardioides thalensis]